MPLEKLLSGLLQAGVMFSVFGAPELRAAPVNATVTSYVSIQEAVDRNPGRLVLVPAGYHVIHKAIRITASNSGLWGPGWIIQANAAEAIVVVEGADGAQVRDVTLTRAEEARETQQPGLHLRRCRDAVVADVRVFENWSSSNAIRVEDCARVVVRDCSIRNFTGMRVDDRTDSPHAGFAFNCTEGTAMNLINVVGALVHGNRIVEHRLLPTPELQKKYDLGKIVKKNAVKGQFISQENWDNNYVNLWRQGASLKVGNGKTSDYLLLHGNFIENAQQGLDVHGDHVIVANNLVDNTPHGIKAMHGARNILIVGNQFAKSDLFGIGLMQGTASHEAGRLPAGRKGEPVANVDGYSIIASNIISDFGRGHSSWLWPVGHSIGPAPIQLGGGAFDETPPLREVLVTGNVVYDPGPGGVLVNGVPQVEAPRYRYAVRTEPGAAAPRGLIFADNVMEPGRDGLATEGLSAGRP